MKTLREILTKEELSAFANYGPTTMKILSVMVMDLTVKQIGVVSTVTKIPAADLVERIIKPAKA